MQLRSILFWLVLVGAMLSACSPKFGFAGPGAGDPQEVACKELQDAVTVTLTVNAGASPSIDIDPEPVCIQRGQKTITWTFSAADKPIYKFVRPAEAFAFKNGGPWWTGPAELLPNGDLRLVFNSFLSYDYPYTLRFTGPEGKRWTCDPTIINHDNALILDPSKMKKNVPCT